MKAKLLLPLIAALLGGCVNLHVYFPEAHDKASEDKPVQDEPAPAAPAGQHESEPAK